MREELNIDINNIKFYLKNTFTINDSNYMISFYKCITDDGEIVLRDHDAFDWVAINNLNNFNFAKADQYAVIQLLKDKK